MVRIAVAGGSGAVAREVIDGLVASTKHDILILSRKEKPASGAPSGTSWAKVDYDSVTSLSTELKNVDVVLSFIVVLTDPDNIAQRNLIDASVQAGVRRFAPSEWATSSVEYMPWYVGKVKIHDYLKEINKARNVLEYCLFQPGMFTNYLTHPYDSTQHFRSFETQIDFQNRRALVRDGGLDDIVTFTTVKDFVNVVVMAVEFRGQWPTVGGMKGTNITIRSLISLGETLRGAAFNVETLDTDSLKRGNAICTWMPRVDHPSIPLEQVDALASQFLCGVLLAVSVGAFKVSGEWNQLLPDYKFTQLEEFLSQYWKDKA